MYDLAVKQQFVRLRALGKSIRSISKTMNISKNTVYQWNTDHAGEIAELRRSLIDLTLIESGVGRIERIKTTAALYNRLKSNLLGNDASKSVPDKESVVSFIRLSQLLDGIDTPLSGNSQPKSADDDRLRELFTQVRGEPTLGESWLPEKEKIGNER